jgi:DNA replication protein DnaC
MNPIPELNPMLKELKLSGILDSLDIRNREAIEEKLPYTDFLALLLQDEIARRANRKLNNRITKAGFRNHKTLENFDFSFMSTAPINDGRQGILSRDK